MQAIRSLTPGSALLAGALATSCGTQIGNPTGAGLIRFTENLDGMNMGHYAYSKAESRVSIKRSYQDAWTQNDVLLACNPATGSVAFHYDQVAEVLTRALFMTEKKLHQDLQHNLVWNKTGQRTLTLVNYEETGQEDITIAFNAMNLQWVRYEIPSGQQEFQIPESGEVIRLEFTRLASRPDQLPLCHHLQAEHPFGPAAGRWS